MNVRLVTRLILALIVGAAASLLKLWVICRRPSSEACVWGKAYQPLGLPIESVAFGLVFLLVLAGMRSLLRSRRPQ